MVKKLFSLLLAMILIISVAGCGRRDSGVSGATSAFEMSPETFSKPSSQSQKESTSYIIPESSETPDINRDTAIFALGLDGNGEKTMSAGDSIGDWTLENLQINRNEETQIQMLEALFVGNVTLEGVISRSVLLEDGYDFQVAEKDTVKMPYYISPEMGRRDELCFVLNIPTEIAGTFSLEHGEQRSCRIVISDYRFIFAYMMAPSSATVTSLETMD